jgi:hypothetical protein
MRIRILIPAVDAVRRTIRPESGNVSCAVCFGRVFWLIRLAPVVNVVDEEGESPYQLDRDPFLDHGSRHHMEQEGALAQERPDSRLSTMQLVFVGFCPPWEYIDLVTHRWTRHRTGPGSLASPMTFTGGLDRFLHPTQARPTAEESLVRWVVQTRQPFIAVEHPVFRAMFDAAGISLPIRCIDTLPDRVQTAFRARREEMKHDLAQSGDSIAVSVDVWTSDHQLAIFAAVGHWLTADFEKREVLLDFAER